MQGALQLPTPDSPILAVVKILLSVTWACDKCEYGQAASTYRNHMATSYVKVSLCCAIVCHSGFTSVVTGVHTHKVWNKVVLASLFVGHSRIWYNVAQCVTEPEEWCVHLKTLQGRLPGESGESAISTSSLRETSTNILCRDSLVSYGI